MKKIAITLLLLSLTGMALFAEGAQEETVWEPGMGRASMPMRGGMIQNQNISEESLILTGKIDLSDINQPKLKVGENTYELMIPYRLDYEINIKDGDEITINGFEVPAYRRTAEAETTSLMVTGATFEGTEYNLDMMNTNTEAYGRRADMMNNYGPANGRQGKAGKYNNRYPNSSRNQGPQPNNMTHRPYGRR